jgi:hypothetical protein
MGDNFILIITFASDAFDPPFPDTNKSPVYVGDAFNGGVNRNNVNGKSIHGCSHIEKLL